MKDLPDIVPRQNLDFYWIYNDENQQPISIVARYSNSKGKTKKWFHQYRLDDGLWIEGAPTPLSLYGINTLPKSSSEEKVYIFEGEKCTSAAHHLDLPAITSMMGSGRAADADWAILAKYRYINEFVLIPDNDIPGHKYIEIVFKEIRKACPYSKISVCQFPTKAKGSDLIDWIQSTFSSMSKWDGFTSISKPSSDFIKNELLAYVNQNYIDAEKYFAENTQDGFIFECPHEPIRETLIPVAPCPIETLPAEVVNWIRGHSMQMQITEDSLVAPFIVNVGNLIGRKRCLNLRPGTSWIEHPNLWGMLVGRSAMMKSPAMNAMMNPLNVLTNRVFKKYIIALKQHQADLEAWKIRKKASDELYKKNFKNMLENTSPESQDDVKCHFEEMPIVPLERRYKTHDATTEKMGELLIENPQGILIYRDELSGWLKNLEKPGRENDRKFILEGWSGKQSFDVDRIGRGRLRIPAVCFSIFGSIQPGPLTQYVREAIQEGVDDDGFIQRFQVMVWPDAKETWELISGIPIAELEIPIQKIFDCLDLLEFDIDGNPVILTFTEKAQELFDQWQGNLERRTRSGKFPPYFESHLSKYKKLLPALCLVLEHLKAALENKHPHIITAETLKDALRWLDYFESHAHRVYESGTNAVIKAANDLIKRIREGVIAAPFTVRDVYYGKHWTGLANPEQVDEVLRFLAEKHYVGSTTTNTGGRSMKKYWINETVFEDMA